MFDGHGQSFNVSILDLGSKCEVLLSTTMGQIKSNVAYELIGEYN